MTRPLLLLSLLLAPCLAAEPVASGNATTTAPDMQAKPRE